MSHEGFDGENDLAYPTFSLCLYHKGGGIFQTGRSDKLCSYPCNNKTYREANYIARKYCIKHCSPMEYYHMLRGNKEDEHNLSSIPFENKAMSIDSITQEFHTQLKTGSKIRKIQFGFVKSNHTFMKSYQDPYHACVTKDGFLQNLVKRDYIELDIITLLALADPDIYVFVHQKGRFLTVLEHPHVVIANKALVDAKRKNKYGFVYDVNLRINTVEVLSKRPNAFIPCDEFLHDEDNLWINKAIEVIGCLPPFFKRFFRNSSSNDKRTISSVCNKNQLTNYEQEYAAKFYFGNISKLYNEPCYQATSVVSLAQSLIPLENEYRSTFATASQMNVKIEIEYAMKGYKKATNHRSFGMLSLWSQIGGFVGMFLGYSLLQLPTVAWKHIRNAFNAMKKSFK